MNYQITDLLNLLSKLDYDKPIYYDSETIGLYGAIRLSQFYQEGWECPLLVENPDAAKLADMILAAHVIGHNIAYDISVIQVALGRKRILPKKVDDTLYLSRLALFYKDSKGLDKVVTEIIGKNPYINKRMISKTFTHDPITEEQLIYAAMDVYYLPIIFQKLHKYTSKVAYKLDIYNLLDSLSFQVNGLPYSRQAMLEMYRSNDKRLRELDLPINANSYKQVRPYLGIYSSDDLALAIAIYNGNEKAIPVREARKLIKQKSYIESYIGSVSDNIEQELFENELKETDRLYGFFSPGAKSGRGTCTHKNLQNIPRELRNGFYLDGYVFLVSDYSQLELRCVCVVTGEAKMERLFRAGEDLHLHTAKELFRKQDISKQERHVAKQCNFMLLYGIGYESFSDNLLTSAGIYYDIEEIKKIVHRWRNFWPAIKRWQNSGREAWNNKTAWQTVLGRRYVANLFTDQLNVQIQGTGAEIAKLANYYINKDMAKEYEGKAPWRDYQVNFVHDSFVFLLPNKPEIYKKVSEIVSENMQKSWNEVTKHCVIKDLPLPVEVSVAKSWGDAENGKNPIYQFTRE